MGKDRLNEGQEDVLNDNPYGIRWIGETPEKIIGTAVIGVLAEYHSVPRFDRVDLFFASDVPQMYFAGGTPGLPVQYFPNRDDINIGGQVIPFEPTPGVDPTERGRQYAETVRKALQERLGPPSPRTPTVPTPRRRGA